MTHREEDKRVRRGNDAAKGVTVIFWRLVGGEEDALLALRVLLLDLVAIFFREAKMISGGLCRWPPNTFWMENGQRWSTNRNSTRHHSNTLHDRAQGQWERPRQRLLPWLPFLHDCLTPNLARIHNQIHSAAHSERKQRPDFSIRLHVVIVCHARKYIAQ